MQPKRLACSSRQTAGLKQTVDGGLSSNGTPLASVWMVVPQAEHACLRPGPPVPSSEGFAIPAADPLVAQQTLQNALGRRAGRRRRQPVRAQLGMCQRVGLDPAGHLQAVQVVSRERQQGPQPPSVVPARRHSRVSGQPVGVST